MKIQEDKTIQQATRTEPQNKKDRTGVDFKKVLSEVQSKIGGAQEKSPLSVHDVQGNTLKVPPAPGVAGIHAATFSDSLAVYEQGDVKKVEHLLDTLESYAHALADSDKNLRDISPLVGLLETGMEEVRVLGEDLPEGDTIRNLARQALILAQVEIARFNRGDYL